MREKISEKYDARYPPPQFNFVSPFFALPVSREAHLCSITRTEMDFAFNSDSPFLLRALGFIFRLGLRKQRIREPPFYLTPRICKERRINCSFTRLVSCDVGEV